MDSLLPIFAQFGITGRVYLTALVGLSDADQRGFVDSMPFTAIQSLLILNGLKSLRSSTL